MTVAGSVFLYVQYIIRSPLLGFRDSLAGYLQFQGQSRRLSAVSGTVSQAICSFRDSLAGYLQFQGQSRRLSAVSGTVSQAIIMHSGKGLCSTWCTVSDSIITVLYLIIVVLI